MNSILMSLKSILAIKDLIIGNEVLKHMECEYTDILQRNYRRGKDFIAGLVNSAIVYGIIGGNIVLYKLASGKTVVLDGRSRLLALHNALYGAEEIDLTKLPFGATKWTIKEGVTMLTDKAYFTTYPTAIKERVNNVEFQVYMLDERTTSLSEARDLFVALNNGLQKMNKDQMNKNMFYGDMTNLIYKLTQESSLIAFVKESDEISDASMGFVGYLVHQIKTGTVGSERDLRNMLKSFQSMMPWEIEELQTKMNELGKRLAYIIGSNKTFANSANACIVAYIIGRFAELGIDVEKNADRIKKGVETAAALIVEYEGTAIGSHTMTKKQLTDMNAWRINGSALRSASKKKIRVEILTNYISAELKPADKDKLPREVAK